MRQRYSKKESGNRIFQSLIGNTLNDAPGTLPGELLSEDESLSDIAELLNESLPGLSLVLPPALSSAISAAGFSGLGAGKDFFVNKHHAAASNANPGTNRDLPLLTVAQAVTNARANSGDRIWVMQQDSWQYGAQTQTSIVENVLVPSTKGGLTFIGDGGGSMGVNWQPATSGSFALTVKALDTKIAGFNFWGGTGGVGSPNGILLDWAGGTALGENTIIENCTFTDDLVDGIRLTYTWFLKIRNNHFQGCLSHGIYSSGSGGIAFVEITDNWFHECGVTQLGIGGAIWLLDSDDSLLSGNKVFNALAQAGASGTNQGIAIFSGARNMVTNNDLSCLLPVPAAGDYDDFNTSSATDAWINNHCMNGLVVSKPA